MSVNEHNQKDPETGEFEKLEFLPEQPDTAGPDTTRLTFVPEPAQAEEPPISFIPTGASGNVHELGQADSDPFARPTDDLGIEVETPFELFGTSLFDDHDADDELPAFDLGEPDDDLEF
jgi:hypothetical protein